MPAELGRITIFCFAASYAASLAVDVARLALGHRWLRWISLGCAGAGLLAHTLFVFGHPLPLQTAFGSLIFLAWILAVFSIYGTVHHSRMAWGLFVLPLVLGLLGLAQLFHEGAPRPEDAWSVLPIHGQHFWAIFHGTLMLLAAVGISVAFVASAMYLVQSHRLKSKLAPGQGLKLWSLERLETMQRRGIVLAFPLLTAGLLVAAAQMLSMPESTQALDNPKVISTVALWVVFGILLYLRYGARAGGKQIAVWTIAAFSLMLLALVAVHPFAQGGPP
jgi:ABC-type transport system involved in cytochrome c biogenesis permease subunit